MNLNSDFTERKYEYWQNGFFLNIYKYSFNYYRNSILLEWYPISYAHIGVGPSINLFNLNSYGEVGTIMNFGFEYKNILLDFNYYDGISFIRKKIYHDNYFKPINSINITLGYKFRLCTPQHGRKGNFPKL